MTEYAYDVKLQAVLRVEAPDRKTAEEKLWLVDAVTAETLPEGVRLTEFSIAEDQIGSSRLDVELFEIDGKDVLDLHGGEDGLPDRGEVGEMFDVIADELFSSFRTQLPQRKANKP